MTTNMDALDYRGKTALHNAVINKDYQQIHNLLKRGASPNIRDQPRGYTPLYYAISQNQDPVSVKLLMEAKAEVDQKILDELIRQSNAEPLNRNLRSIRETLLLQRARPK